MASLPKEAVNNVVGFLGHDSDIANLSQVNTSFVYLRKKVHDVRMAEHLKLKKIVCSLATAICYMREMQHDDDEFHDIGLVLNKKYDFDKLAGEIDHFPGDIEASGGYLSLDGKTDEVIIRHFLDQMD